MSSIRDVASSVYIYNNKHALTWSRDGSHPDVAFTVNVSHHPH